MFSLQRLELYGIAIVILGLLFTGAEFHGRYVGRNETKDEFAAQALKQAEESRATEQAQRDKYQAGVISYEQQIAQLKIDAATRPSKSCWVPKPATTVVPETSVAPARIEPTSANGPSGANGEFIDVGPAITQTAYDCKAIAIRLNKVLELWPR